MIADSSLGSRCNEGYRDRGEGESDGSGSGCGKLGRLRIEGEKASNTEDTEVHRGNQMLG
jgi:hypothetical protein